MTKFKKKNILLKLALFLFIGVFAFLVAIPKTYAYTLESNGNIKSENLLDLNDYYNKSDSVTLQNDSLTFNVSAPIVMQFYDSSMNFISEFLAVTSNGVESATFTRDSNYYYLRIKSNYDNRQVIYNINYLVVDNEYTISCLCSNYDSIGVLLNIMLNSGSVALDYEPYGIWYSKQNYDNAINDAVVDYQSSLTYYSLTPFTSSIRLLVSDNGYDNWTTLNISSYLSYSVVDNYYQLNFSGLTQNKHYQIIFDLAREQYLNYMYFSNANFEKVLLNGNSYTLTNLLYNGQYYWFENLSLIDSPVTSYGFQFLAYGSTNSKKFQAKGVDISVLNTSESYNQGYENGVASQQSTIDSLNNRVSDLEDRLNNNLGWQSLFFSLADTPFRTVYNMLGWDLLGVNLMNAFVGFITVLGILWLLKKLWK